MPEAKSLTHMALTAMFATMLLAAASGLIGVGYLMWSAFSSQSATNERMQQFARYAAFDTANVRGQDIISLIHDTQGDPVVIVIGPKNGVSCQDYVDWLKNNGTGTPKGEVVLMSGNNVTSVLDFKDEDEFRVDGKHFMQPAMVADNFNALTSTGDWVARIGVPGWSWKAEDKSYLGSYNSSKPTAELYAALNFSSDESKPSYEDLQTYFLSRGRMMGELWNKSYVTDTVSVKDGYLQYASFIIYDAVSSDVAGVVFVEQVNKATLSEKE